MRCAAAIIVAGATVAQAAANGESEKKQYGAQMQGVIAKMEELKQDSINQKKQAQEWITKFNAHALQFYHSKTEDLKNTNQQIEAEEAKLARAEAAIKAASEAIGRLEHQLETLASDMTQINTVRKEEHDIFAVEQKEATAAIAACEKAVGILAPKVAATSAAAFLQKDMDGVHSALVQLQADVPAKHRGGNWEAVSMLLEMAQGAMPQGDTSAWMGGGPKRVIEIIEEVKTSISEHLQEVRAAETANVNAHEMKLSELQQTEKFATVEKEKEEAAKAEAEANKASAEAQLGGSGAGGLRESAKSLKKHLADQKIVVDRTEKEYAAAQVARMNEIKMIDQAIAIIQNKVSSKVVNEIQKSASTSFVQIRMEKKTADIDLAKQEKLAKFLQEKGIGYNSKVLIQMAQLAAASPFDKVVKMIKQLILKLTNEVSEAQEISGWCDARLTAYKDSLEKATDKITQSQICQDAKTSESEAQAQTIDEVRAELKKATEELAELRSDYSESKTDSDTDIADQKAATEGLEEALEVLRSFYNNEDNQAALSTGNMDLSDETGNDAGGFAGDFAASEGTGADQNTNTVEGGNRVVDFLENILADIKADIQERTTAAALAKTDFQTTERDMIGEKAALTTQLDADIATLGQLKDKLNDCKQDLEMGQDSKREQDEYYANVLEKKCVTDDVTFKEKSEKRQAEITSLQEALEILENA
jgi:hypothetical protein